MRRFSLADILDVLFYTLAVCFLAFGVLRYFKLNFWVCLTFALLFAALTCVFCSLFLGGKRQKKARGKREKAERDALLLHLALEKEERVRAAMVAAFTADGKTANCVGDVLEADGTLIVPIFTMEPVSADAVALAIKTYGASPFTVACNALSASAEKLLLSFGKGAMRGDDVYALFARTNSMPQPLICGQLPRKSFKDNLRRSFSKRNARPFLVSGLLLLLMSLFTLFPVYYLASGSILLATAVVVRAVGFSD